MSSPSSVAINQFQVPPSYDVMGDQDPFDFLGSDVFITGDDCSSSCVYSIDEDSSSVSTVQHANTETERVSKSFFYEYNSREGETFSFHSFFRTREGKC